MNANERKKKNFSYATLFTTRARVARDDIFQMKESKSSEYSFYLSDSQPIPNQSNFALSIVLSSAFVSFVFPNVRAGISPLFVDCHFSFLS